MAPDSGHLRKARSSGSHNRGRQRYQDLEGTALWKCVDSVIGALVQNSDIELTTDRDHVVRYICQRIANEVFR